MEMRFFFTAQIQVFSYNANWLALAQVTAGIKSRLLSRLTLTTQQPLDSVQPDYQRVKEEFLAS